MIRIIVGKRVDRKYRINVLLNGLLISGWRDFYDKKYNIYLFEKGDRKSEKELCVWVERKRK